MQSFSRGWSFLKEAWQMAFKDKDLIKPSIMALFAGLIVSVIFIPLMVGAGFLTGGDNSLVGQVALFVLGAVMVFIQYTVGYIFSAMTVYLVYGYLAEGDGVMSKAWAVVKRDFFDLMSLAAASTAVNLLKNAIRGKGRSVGRNFFSGLIDTVWTEASFLILPAMVIEDINLKNALKRAGNIIKNNLLLVGISTVGVKTVNGLIGFLLGALGIGLGFGVGFGIITITNASVLATFGLVSGIGLGVFIAGIFIMVATVVTSYTTTAYHTCLYLWARDVEKAQAAGSSAQVRAPAPLAAVLNR
jgi:membrane-anchored glycerophosphoryl diester phosphodiesterase (GDPDase)